MNASAVAIERVLSGRTLLSIEEACLRASAHAPAIAAWEVVDLHESVGRTLAEPIVATTALPRFDQSAMDGYAVFASSVSPGAHLPVSTRIIAGEVGPQLRPGTAVRIMTGAPVPPGADAVIMQEHVARRADEILVPTSVQPGANIRRQGEDIGRGELLLHPGQALDARHVALLAAQGVCRVRVLRPVRVAILSTGNELRQPGETLSEATIFDTNRPMLLALARLAGLDAVDGGWVPDDRPRLSRRLIDLAERADLVVTTGGASGGDEDHTSAALTLAGGTAETLQMALKPGKPAIVGRIGPAAYLGLPGNPVSALVSWLLLGRTMLACLQGREPPPRLGYPLPLIGYFDRRPGRTEFVPARLTTKDGSTAIEILGRGGSARLKPLVGADGLAEIAAELGQVRDGAVVRFHPFMGGFGL